MTAAIIALLILGVLTALTIVGFKATPKLAKA